MLVASAGDDVAEAFVDLEVIHVVFRDPGTVLGKQVGDGIFVDAVFVGECEGVAEFTVGLQVVE